VLIFVSNQHAQHGTVAPAEFSGWPTRCFPGNAPSLVPGTAGGEFDDRQLEQFLSRRQG